MISKKTLKEYEFKSIFDYFDYIVESKINGNYAQVKELIKSLSSKQWIGFCEYVLNHLSGVEYILSFIKARED